MSEVADVCRRFGFEMLAPGDLPLEQQIESFSQARVVVGVHGSALVNAIFRRNAKLTMVEILPPRLGPEYQPRPWWFYLATVLGHDHELFYADDGSGAALGKAAFRRDFAVDSDRLAAKLAAILDRV